MHEGVAVKAAQPRELRLRKRGNGAEDAHLLGVLQLGLEADHVEQGAQPVVLAQLHDGIGFYVWLMWIGQAERFHRAVAQGLAPALGHHLDGRHPSK